MMPDLLMAHFDRVSDAPDAIPRLRRLILDLAVRGKLVEQDPKDGPASFLYERLLTCVKKQRERLKVTDRKEVPAKASASFGPDQFPSSWALTNFDSVNTIASGVAKGKDLRGFKTASYPYLRVANVQRGYLNLDVVKEIELRVDEFEKYELHDGDVLMTEGGDWDKLGRAAIWRCEIAHCIHQNHIFRIRSASKEQLLPEWITLIANSDLGRKYFEDASKQTTNLASINMTQLRRCPLPLPTTPEQKRIVVKVSELMALCDRLAAARAERETRRRVLVAAANHHLVSSADPAMFRRSASFYFNNLPRLTATKGHINTFRKTILNLAIKGSLVLQDSGDRPASELLERIQLEKLALVDRNELKKFDLGQPPKLSQFEFPLPSGWAPATLQQLCLSVTDGDHLPPPKADEGVPFLVIGNVRSQFIEFAGCRYVSEEYYRALDPIRCPRKGDLLYTLVGSYGIPVIVTDDRQFCVQRHIGILRPSRLLNLKFLHRVLESDWVFRQATAVATGIAQKTVPLSGLRRILVPLPPLAEQDRIVAKVDELMKLCDELDARITSDAEVSQRLLEAVLSKAVGITETSAGRGFGVDRNTNNPCPEEGKLNERTI